ncbi:hypothetical protein FUAX_14350 [Fulvitalea axinellae]|uniref:N-acetyltransferase domain-containing protein n=1 Tax=Fulvitalea axinellae TaxID=1182444 RepID=A0AAU9CLS9_9BACT|nr:hypothetical protein FUAX_14350 [Fulvitalea axinellae]
MKLFSFFYSVYTYAQLSPEYAEFKKNIHGQDWIADNKAPSSFYVVKESPEEDALILGGLEVRGSESSLEILDMWVRESHRNQGLGGYLLYLAERASWKNGTRLSFATQEKNLGEFLTHKGYEISPDGKAEKRTSPQPDMFVRQNQTTN